MNCIQRAQYTANMLTFMEVFTRSILKAYRMKRVKVCVCVCVFIVQNTKMSVKFSISLFQYESNEPYTLLQLGHTQALKPYHIDEENDFVPFNLSISDAYIHVALSLQHTKCVPELTSKMSLNWLAKMSLLTL